MSIPIAERRHTGIIYLLFFLSGVTGLVYEVVWTRMFAITFGATAFAISTVLAAFMAGLALGSFYFGRFIDRRGDPIKIYALLEILIGVYALVLPFLMLLLDRIYTGIYHQFSTSLTISIAARFILSFIVLMIPATLMGGTLPVLSKFLATRLERLGLKVGSLYSINTIGGAVGCFVAGFTLIELLGIRDTIYVASGVNLIIGIVALALRASIHRSDQPDPDAVPTQQPDDPADLPVDDAVPPLSIRLIVVGFGLSGFAALAYEVIWARVLSMILGTTVYAFSIMLTSFLCGLALGSFILGRFIDKRRHLIPIFGGLQIAIGCFGVLSVFTFSKLPFLFLKMFAILGNSWRDFTFIQFVLVFLIMLVPTTLMGAMFPLVSRIYTRQIKRLGRSIGDVYSANTVGSILGSVAAGFFLIPLIGLQNSIKLIASINVLIGLSVLISSGVRFAGAIRRSVIAVAAVGLLVFLTLITVCSWDKSMLANGVYFRPSQFLDANNKIDLDASASGLELLYYAEGFDSTVAIFGRGPERMLVINGMTLASNRRTDVTLLGMVGHLPALLHESPESVLVIGLGAGVTSGMAAQHESVKKVDCVELERKVPNATRYFSRENRNVLDDPKLTVIMDDGRNFLQKTSNKYDVITSDPIHPWLSGAGSLYAVEHFQACKDRLNEGGVVAQWLPLYEMPERDFKTVIRTFQSVFPHTSLWLMESDAILVGTADKTSIDYGLLERKLQDEKIESDMRVLYVDSIYQFLTFFTMGEEKLATYAADARLNTDDHPILEFSAPEGLYAQTVEQHLESMRQNMELITPLLHNIGNEEEAPKIEKKLLEYFEEKADSLKEQLSDLRAYK
ncbi:fused MFS/spermidine synthase [Candidatus Poribacteria bacterium]